MNPLRFDSFKLVIFDFDGVIANSNPIKTRAFYLSALKYLGEDCARHLSQYHIQNGGISRYEKFKYILNHASIKAEKKELLFSQLLHEFSYSLARELSNVDIACNLSSLRQACPQQKWFIASGSDENELKDLCDSKNISCLFDGGIYGSPRDKVSIVTSLLEVNPDRPAIMIGDSKLDYDASLVNKISFIFCKDWSDTSIEAINKLCPPIINSIGLLSELQPHHTLHLATFT